MEIGTAIFVIGAIFLMIISPGFRWVVFVGLCVFGLWAASVIQEQNRRDALITNPPKKHAAQQTIYDPSLPNCSSIRWSNPCNRVNP